MMNTTVRPDLPTAEEVTLARESSRLLSLYLSSQDESQSIRVIDAAGEHEAVRLPTAAYRLLIDILSEMAQGNAVSLIPVHAELTTQEAADMLNVSRPHLVKLLDGGTIPFHKVGTHRRVYYQDLVSYKNRIDADRTKALEELAAQAQELNMGY
ncbi:helix-turn-helix domain-containing protein [Thauera humireducens]|jgi:excisionase family DNA binding protein|uniref:helix-turn-helix domain-containing protein n=1 Tax=Thauera humireducens TaxID=1134435 RepID=UPI0024A944F0|nr:helix-turn-helix domain-containing protein [Thauera humireducens]